MSARAWMIAGAFALAAMYGGYKTMWPRGLRNNNPGNIERTDTVWDGEIRGEAAEARDERFAVFEHPGYGLRALAVLLRNYFLNYGLDTPRKIIERYAPGHENDTDAYAQAVAGVLGVGVDESFDVRARMPTLIRAIVRHENGIQPYSGELIREAVAAAEPDTEWA